MVENFVEGIIACLKQQARFAGFVIKFNIEPAVTLISNVYLFSKIIS